MRARWLGVALVAGSLLLGVTGLSASARPVVDAQAWAHTGAVTTFTPSPDHIYVVASLSTEEARAFVRLAPVDATPESFVDAVLVLSPAEDAMLADRAAVRACLLAAPFEGDGQLEGAAPDADCNTSVAATRAENGEWRVPLGAFARPWLAGRNHGLALVPDLDGAAATFRLAFDTTLTVVEAPSLPAPPPTADGAAPGGAPATTSTTGATTVPQGAIAPPEAVAVDHATAPTSPVAGIDEIGIAAPVLTTRTGGGAFSPSGFLAVVAFALAGGLTIALRTRPALATGSAAAALLGPARRVLDRPLPRLSSASDGVRAAAVVGVCALAVAPLTASELTIYRATLIPVYIVAVFGLHVLVNWAGELSLAHASAVAVPAFTVLAISAVHDVSPLLLLPVAIVVGGLIGLIVSLPALKVRGVHVAIVTLAAGVAVNQFLLTKPWLVGPLEGYTAATPSLGPLRFESNRSVYPVILLLTLGALAVGWALLHSRVARAMFWVRADPSAASAFGIPVARYRMLAFAIAGAFGGLAGGMMVVAVGRLTPGSFPTTLSFAYLVPVILVGPGFAGGIIAVAVLLQGGPLFIEGAGRAVQYLGPVALVLSITRYRAGLHGAGRSLMERLDASRTTAGARERTTIRAELLSGVAVACIVAGIVAIAIAWYRSGNTDQVWIQNQELLSGGIGGLALVIVGTGVLLGDRVVRSHRQLAEELRSLRAESPAPAQPIVAGTEDASTPTRRRAPRRTVAERTSA